MGFVQTTSDPCLYIALEGEMFMIAVHVDDIILGGKSNKRMDEVKEAIAQHFKIKDMGELHYFLGLKVIQDKKTGSDSQHMPKASCGSSAWKMQKQLTHLSMLV